jgi:hypothetical protein
MQSNIHYYYVNQLLNSNELNLHRKIVLKKKQPSTTETTETSINEAKEPSQDSTRESIQKLTLKPHWLLLKAQKSIIYPKKVNLSLMTE